MKEEVLLLVLQLAVILLAARFCDKAARKIKAPAVLGELVAGILIGPFLLGRIGLPVPGLEHGMFPLPATGHLPVSTPLYAIATVGSIVLLFLSGLETDLRMFFRYSVAGTVVGVGGVVFSFAFGTGLGMALLHAPAMDPRCLFLGILCTATSVGITARILAEKKSIDSPEGTTILAAAVIDDVLGIICLAVVMGIVAVAGAGGEIDWSNIRYIAFKSVAIWLGFTAAGVLGAHWIARFLKRFPPAGEFSVLAFGLALLLAGIFEEAGLAMIIGAYVMGLSLSRTDVAFAIRRALSGVYDFLVPVFFVVMGMLVDIRVFGDMNVLGFGLLYSALAILAKVLGCALPACFMNFNALGALRIGAGMIPRGEVALIIAGIGATTLMKVGGVDVPVIDARLFGVAIIMTLLTTLAAPPLLAMMLSRPGSGVRRRKIVRGTVRTEYKFSRKSTAEFVLWVLVENLRSEGFRHSEIGHGGGLIQFRKDALAFSLNFHGGKFVFESPPAEAGLIRTAMCETGVELHQAGEALRRLSVPENFAPPSGKKTALPGKLDPYDVIPPGGVLVDFEADSIREAIEKLLRVLENSGRLADFKLCRDDVLAREKEASTCVEPGIALPHARTAGAGTLAAAVGICRRGFRASGKSGNRIHLVVLTVCPPDAEEPYLQFVSSLAAILLDPRRKEEIMNAKDGAGVMRILAAAEKRKHAL